MFKLSAGSIQITPQQPIPLAGYGWRRKSVYSGIASDLEINVIRLQTETQTLLFISTDSLYSNPDIKQIIIETLDLEESRYTILLGASHTHFAPASDDAKPKLGLADQTYCRFVSSQTNVLMSRMNESTPHPVRTSYIETSGRHSINRRKVGWRLNRRNLLPTRGIASLPNEDAPRSDSIHLFVFDNEDDKVTAVLWNYACHPVCAPHRNHVCADFPGTIRDQLRSHFDNPNLPVVFYQGFAGNIRPLILDHSKTWSSKLIRFIQRGPIFPMRRNEDYANDKTNYDRWTQEMFATIKKGLSLKRRSIKCEKFFFNQCTIPLSKLINDTNTLQNISVQVLQIDQHLLFIAISAEVNVEYIALLQKNFPDKIIIPIGYIDHVYGYLPTNQQVKEGGYEAHGFFKNFNLNGDFRDDVEEVILKNITALLKSN